MARRGAGAEAWEGGGGCALKFILDRKSAASLCPPLFASAPNSHQTDTWHMACAQWCELRPHCEWSAQWCKRQRWQRSALRAARRASPESECTQESKSKSKALFLSSLNQLKLTSCTSKLKLTSISLCTLNQPPQHTISVEQSLAEAMLDVRTQLSSSCS